MFDVPGPDWERDGRDWPNRDYSSFVETADLRWHVQLAGSGPVVLLLHGTGAATHSWRSLVPLLAKHFTVVAPDLPGHGFTGASQRDSHMLPGMSRAIAGLLKKLDLKPDLAVGHSAGAAILIRMALDGNIAPRTIVSINGALFPFRGLASQFFSPLARLLVINPVVPRVFAWGASGSVSVERLIRDTGSAIDADGIALYQRLMQSPGHVAGALRMMAGWDLHALQRDLPKLKVPLLLVATEKDRAVPPDQAFAARDILPDAKVEYLRGVGHLAHEERPEEIAELILRAARAAGLIPETVEAGA